MTEEQYNTALICLNGHMINEMADSYPDFDADFCDKCRASTIRACPNCKTKIRGQYADSMSPRPLPVPSFCHGCGKPYPWTDARLEAAHDLAGELENISESEKEILKTSLDDMVRDSPRTTLAITRFKKIMVKAGKGGADALRNLLVDILSEAVRKQIWP